MTRGESISITGLIGATRPDPSVEGEGPRGLGRRDGGLISSDRPLFYELLLLIRREIEPPTPVPAYESLQVASFSDCLRAKSVLFFASVLILSIGI